MATQREERIARNESLFRLANERLSEWEERDRADATEPYFCECADPECDQKVGLRATDYERVRSDSGLFFAVPGHEIPDVEAVVERHEGWVVIQKDPEVGDVVEETDPRQDGG